MPQHPIILAGYPDRFPTVYHRVRFLCGDMVVHLDEGDGRTTIICRGIERPRALASGATEVFAVEEMPLSGPRPADRNAAFAQAAAELLRRKEIRRVVSDAMLPLIFVDALTKAGVTVTLDGDLGIMDRRRKDASEVEHLRESQRQTEEAIRRAFEIMRDAEVHERVLHHDGSPLTSEVLRAEIAMHLLRHGLSAPNDSIAAGGPIGADCHHRGAGPLLLDEPVILDVFPVHLKSRYYGDCTRTLMRGGAHPKVAEMHAAVVEAKAAAIAVCRAGVTGAEVHHAVTDLFRERGYHVGLPPDDAPPDLIFYPHGTGHGIGLECHEPPYLNDEGVELVEGDALTIEPALYCHAVGGVRIEDMVIVQRDGCENLNTLPEELWWE